MNVLITFVPWLCYWIFLSFGKIYLAVWLAFISALSLSLNELRKGTLKILTIGTMLFFLLMIFLVSFTRPSWLWHEISLMGNLALAIITFLSILLRKPFTMQYAIETTPKERWADPGFIHANYVITWAWLAAFVIMAMPSASGLFGIELPIWFIWTFSFLCFIGASAFTSWYKKVSRKSA